MNPQSSHSPLPELGPDATATDTAALPPEVLRQELARQTDLHLRLAAEFENFKKRSSQESEARAAAQKDLLILELLPVIDNLERALATASVGNAGPLHQGVAMTLKQLQQLLRQHGVESPEIVGQLFNPHRHDALAQGHNTAQPDHAILEVIQRGYQRGTKVVRPAKVVVNDRTAATPHPHGR